MIVEPEAADDDDSPTEPPGWPGHPSWALVISLALLAGSAWLWLIVGERPSPPAVGSRFPPTRLERFEGERADPFWVFGLEGRVTWLVFLPVDAPEGLKPLARLEPFRREFRANRRFSIVAAVVNPRRLGRPATVEGRADGGLPLYVAGGEVQRLFGVDRASAPRHVLIDPRGRIDLIVDGSDRETIARVARRARLWLGAMAPPRDPRFLLVRVD